MEVRKIKHITTILLSLLISIGAFILLYIYAIDSTNGSEITDVSGPIQVLTSTVMSNEDLAGTSTTKQFNIPAGYGYVQVTFRNTGSKQFTFTINQGSAAGAMQMSGTVPADGEEYEFSNDKAWSTGEFYISTSSAQGMSGTLDVHLGTLNF